MILKTLKIHTLVTLVFGLLSLVAPHYTYSVLLGGGVMGFNILAIVWVWQRIFIKKSIALAASVIVFKYAILGLIIYLALEQKNVQPIGFFIGLTTVMPSMVYLGLSDRHLTNEKVKI